MSSILSKMFATVHFSSNVIFNLHKMKNQTKINGAISSRQPNKMPQSNCLTGDNNQQSKNNRFHCDTGIVCSFVLFFFYCRVISLSIMFGIFFSRFLALRSISNRIIYFFVCFGGMNSCKSNKELAVQGIFTFQLFSLVLLSHSSDGDGKKTRIVTALNGTNKLFRLFVFRVTIFRIVFYLSFVVGVQFAPNATLQSTAHTNENVAIIKYGCE